MRHFFYILCIAFAMFSATPAEAQNAPIGKRIPDVKPDVWLNEVRPLRDAKLTCVEFFHPASTRSRKNIEHLKSLAENFARKDFQVVIVAGGDADSVSEELLPLTADGIAVGLDLDNDCFEALEVNYLPACLIFDSQRKAVWTGDSKLLTAKLIDNLKQQ